MRLSTAARKEVPGVVAAAHGIHDVQVSGCYGVDCISCLALANVPTGWHRYKWPVGGQEASMTKQPVCSRMIAIRGPRWPLHDRTCGFPPETPHPCMTDRQSLTCTARFVSSALLSRAMTTSPCCAHTQTPRAPPPPVAAMLSPILWQLNCPDRFDMYSAGVLLLQACTQLVSVGF